MLLDEEKKRETLLSRIEEEQQQQQQQQQRQQQQQGFDEGLNLLKNMLQQYDAEKRARSRTSKKLHGNSNSNRKGHPSDVRDKPSALKRMEKFEEEEAIRIADENSLLATKIATATSTTTAAAEGKAVAASLRNSPAKRPQRAEQQQQQQMGSSFPLASALDLASGIRI